MAEIRNYTQAEYDALLQELSDTTALLATIKDDIATAKGFGDLSENSEYDDAKNREAQTAMKISELEERVKYAVVVDESKIDHTKVSVGSLVEVENIETKVKKTYHIVGSYGTDPLAGKISDQSAIGSALIGKSVDAKVDVELPSKKTIHLIIRDVRRANA